MIHIATVHYQSDRWIDIQLDHLAKHIKQPFRVYAFLCGDAAKHRRKFFYSSVEPIKEHAVKLNVLADIIHFAADPNDHLVFIDGDAFPVAPLDDLLAQVPGRTPLAAVVRSENYRDTQPHPSFCLTTVGFWNRIKGDWGIGIVCQGESSDVYKDVGGKLLAILNDRNIGWKKILRTSANPYHPLFFGIYGHAVYHHGAGFRNPTCRQDISQSVGSLYKSRIIGKLYEFILNQLSLKNRKQFALMMGIRERIIEKNIHNAERVFRMILRSDEEFLTFVTSGGSDKKTN